MFCPNCATENAYGVKYCRSCGSDLELVSQAMTRRVRWTSVFASRLDDFFGGRLQREERENMREGGSQLAIGGSLAAIAWLHLAGFSGMWLAVFLFFVALLLILSGLGNIWVSKRRRAGAYEPELERLPDDLSIFKPAETPATKLSAPVSLAQPRGETQRDFTAGEPSSITEQTTKHLDASGARPKE